MRGTVRMGLRGVLAIGVLGVVTAQAGAGPTTNFTVTGDVVAPATYDLATLGALPPTTETVTFQTISGPQTGTFTGPTLWTLLNTVGLQTPAVKNGILRQYVVAQGSDSYTALFSLGELAPQFGGSNPQILTAYQENGAPLGATTETVTYLAGGTPVTATFTGVSLWTLLTDAGIITDPAVKNDILNYYVLATGSDGYEAIFSLGELDPMFGGSGAPDLIAYLQDGMPLGADGFARVVVPGDNFGGRYVPNLVSLQVIDAVVPEPGSLLLLASSLLAMVLLQRRRAVTAAGFVLLSAGPAAWADVMVDIPALQDATLFGGSAVNNSSSGPGMFVGSDGQGQPKRGLIEFDVPAYLPSNATITGATLTLYLGQVAGSGGAGSGGDQTPRTIRLFDVTTAWAGSTNGTTGFPGPGFGGTGQGFPANIGDTTWNAAKYSTIPWNTPGGGGDFVSAESADTVVGQTINSAYSWGSTAQMTADVQGWLDGTLPNYGWLLKNDSETGQTAFRAFYTREGATEQGVPQFAPDLVVSFVVPAPEPSTSGIFAVAALTIALLSRRQRRTPAV